MYARDGPARMGRAGGGGNLVSICMYIHTYISRSRQKKKSVHLYHGPLSGPPPNTQHTHTQHKEVETKVRRDPSVMLVLTGSGSYALTTCGRRDGSPRGRNLRGCKRLSTCLRSAIVQPAFGSGFGECECECGTQHRASVFVRCVCGEQLVRPFGKAVHTYICT